MIRWFFYRFYPRIEIAHQNELDLANEEIFALHAALRRLKLVLLQTHQREIRLRRLLACLEQDISSKMLSDAEEFLRNQQGPDGRLDG